MLHMGDVNLMNKQIKKLGYTLLSAIISIILYILLHELGHTIVILTAGGTITDFSIFTAHVSAIGGNYNSTSNLWLHINGALLPIIISFIYILAYKKNSNNSFYRIFSYMFTLVPTASALAWVILPFIYMQGNVTANDDVIKFLCDSSKYLHPLIVSVLAAGIIGISIFTMIKKQIVQNFITEIRTE